MSARAGGFAAPLAVVAGCVFAAVAGAQTPPPELPPEFFAGRRQALMKRLAAQVEPGQRHLVFLRGAAARGDMAVFAQDQDFYYLSGVVEPDASMLLWPAAGEEMLLVPPFSRFTATWEGERLVPGEEAAARTGFASVENSRSLLRRLRAEVDAAGEGEKTVIWTLLEAQAGATATPASASRAASAAARDRFDGRRSRERQLQSHLERMFEGAEVRDLTGLVGQIRAVKTADEIAQVRVASSIAVEGLAEAMRCARPGVYEYQLAAAARYVFTRLGAGPDAYAAIVGAGPNGCVLHYSANTRQLQDGDLIVMDYGPTVHGYCTDVTRTFPANGVFTAAQRQLVEDVHEVQQALIAEVRPGQSLSQLGALCGRLLQEKGYRPDHGPCHHVGLAVHDKQGDVLEPGMLITVEPGAYLREEGMGCRIEDVVLVTADGCENLTAHLPARPDDIEQWMAGDGIQQHGVGLRRD